ncbi:MAG: biotin--[acetyl-CoA-carboxylase] ligase [Campylobacter sp.]|uniref:biotin--[acetyl-CoA-carboxylase] ligase n=1 Tax=Campylobacter sp. TaxID=205 RepID=UPI0036244FE4
MRIEFADSVPSTQKVLVEGLRNGEIRPPFALVAKEQTQGVGSRNNTWSGLEGNLFFSFCMSETALPGDLKGESASIYFSVIMREALAARGSKIWLKWPNDFYIGDKKIGGTLTTKVGEIYVCGMGINLKNAPENAGILDIYVSPSAAVGEFCKQLQTAPSWAEVFRKFESEFEKSREFITHFEGEEVALKDAKLLSDGSLDIGGRRVFSLR